MIGDAAANNYSDISRHITYYSQRNNINWNSVYPLLSSIE
jgi:hypothetical protein